MLFLAGLSELDFKICILLPTVFHQELQCSDWSQRPLTEEQKKYAAADAHCLVEIFNVFHAKVVREGWGSSDSCKHLFGMPLCDAT